MGFRWRVIAGMLPGRSDDAVRNRWNRLQEAMRDGTPIRVVGGERPKAGYKCSKCGQPKRNHVCTYQPGSALAVAQAAAKQQRQQADGDKLRVSWTLHEDDTIRQFVSRVGPRWSLIAAELPGRTEHAVRNRYHRLQNLDANSALLDEVVGTDAMNDFGEYIGLVDDDSGTHDNDGSATHHLPPSRTLTPPLLNDQTGSGSASACGVDDDRTLDGAMDGTMDGTMDGVLSLPSPSDAPAVAASRNDLSAADIA